MVSSLKANACPYRCEVQAMRCDRCIRLGKVCVIGPMEENRTLPTLTSSRLFNRGACHGCSSVGMTCSSCTKGRGNKDRFWQLSPTSTGTHSYQLLRLVQRTPGSSHFTSVLGFEPDTSPRPLLTHHSLSSLTRSPARPPTQPESISGGRNGMSGTHHVSPSDMIQVPFLTPQPSSSMTRAVRSTDIRPATRRSRVNDRGNRRSAVVMDAAGGENIDKVSV